MMMLSEENRELRRHLKDAAYALQESALDACRLAALCSSSETVAALRKADTLFNEAERLLAYAEEVKVGTIIRYCLR